MRLGCCGGLDIAHDLKEAGFDFIEVNVQAMLRGDMPGSEWDRQAPDPATIALPIEAANCLLPGTLPVVGPDRDESALQDYMQRVAKRAQRLGIERFVFGSGAARRAPDGYPRRSATADLRSFSRMAGEICAHHGVVVVIEHLNKSETNTINSLKEAAQLVDAVAHPNLRALVDSYHFGVEHESDEALIALGDRIAHVHVAEPIDRIQPGGHERAGDAAKSFDFDHFFCLLRKLGYEQRVSIEARWATSLEADAPACVEMLRTAWDSAGRCLQ